MKNAFWTVDLSGKKFVTHYVDVSLPSSQILDHFQKISLYCCPGMRA